MDKRTILTIYQGYSKIEAEWVSDYFTDLKETGKPIPIHVSKKTLEVEVEEVFIRDLYECVENRTIYRVFVKVRLI